MAEAISDQGDVRVDESDIIVLDPRGQCGSGKSESSMF
jgi:hypothetical protein